MEGRAAAGGKGEQKARRMDGAAFESQREQN